MSNMMAKKNYDLTEITRFLLEMRDNCLQKKGDAYDDPKRKEKYAALNDAIDLINNPSLLVNGDTSDGYHTFNELSHHRAVLFSVIVKAFPDKAWKARKHHDGSMYDGMFIVGIETPDGQATYHYDIDPYWDMFDCPEVEFAPEWDGHTAEQAIERIGKLEPDRVHGRWIEAKGAIRCSECMNSPLYDYHGRLKLSNACPTCGVKMLFEKLPMQDGVIRLHCRECDKFDVERVCCRVYGDDCERAIKACATHGFAMYHCGAKMDKEITDD